jgi:hypothetical protein
MFWKQIKGKNTKFRGNLGVESACLTLIKQGNNARSQNY